MCHFNPRFYSVPRKDIKSSSPSVAYSSNNGEPVNGMPWTPNSYLDAASVPIEQNQDWIRNNTLSKDNVMRQPKSVEGIGQYGGQDIRAYKLTPESLSSAVSPANGQEPNWTNLKRDAAVQPLRQTPASGEEILRRYNELRRQYGSPPISQSQLYPTDTPKFRVSLEAEKVKPNNGGISRIVKQQDIDSQWLSQPKFDSSGSIEKWLQSIGVLGSQNVPE